MRHWWLAVAALLGLSVAAAQADYFLIRINLEARNKGNGQQAGGGKGMPFGGGMMGGFNPPGGAFGGPPGGGMTGPPGGGMTGPPGMGGMMQMQQMMMKGGGNQKPAKTDAAPEEDVYDPNSLHTDIIVEVNHFTYRQITDPKTREENKAIVINHKWGQTWLTENDTFIAIKQVKRPVISRWFKKQELYKRPEKTADDWVSLARLALKVGLLKEVKDAMDGAAKADKNNPIVQLYQRVHADMDRPITGVDQADFWKDRLPGYQVERSDHYSLLYRQGDNNDNKTVHGWIRRLERNYEAFFDWFLLHGKALTVPTTRLVAVVVSEPDQFDNLQKGLGPTHLEADGFYARRDNLAVFSAEPRGKAYKTLLDTSSPLWTTGAGGYNFDRLLKGKGKKDASAAETEDAQMRALAVTAMRDRAQTTAVSAEGTRQLAAAVGLLPRDVKVPKWFQSGLASFFETPHEAYWEGTGAASQLYLPQFKTLAGKEKLDKPDEVLRKTVTDAYFKLPKVKPEKELLKARTLAWGLTYYLMENDLDGVLRFCQELGNLPRDMDLDPNLVLACFNRAFNLGSMPQPGVTTSVFADKARSWFSRLRMVEPPCPDPARSLDSTFTKKSGSGGGKGGPGGGLPPAPGGGFPPFPQRPGG